MSQVTTEAAEVTPSGGPSEGSNQSLQLTWPSQVDGWICINEANYGGSTAVTWNTGNTFYWWNLGEVVVKYYAVFIPKTASYDYTSIIGATTSGSEDLDFSLFASDSDGFPTGSSLLDWTTTIADTTFQHRETSVSSTAFTKGLHWLAVGVQNSCLMLGNMAAGFGIRNTGTNYQNMPSVTPFVNIPMKDDSITALATDDFSYYLREASATSIPASITLSDLELGGQHRVGSFYQGKVIPAVYLREAS